MVNPLLFPVALLLKSSSSRFTVRSSTSALFSSQSSSSSSLLPCPLVDPSTGETVDNLDEKLRKKRVALYFAAGWCPMCTSFEPPLLQFREASEQSGKPVELIYVSSDRKEEDATKRASQLDMMTVPFGDKSSALKQKYKIWAGSEAVQFGFGRRSGVPAIVVLDQKGEELAFVPAESQGPKSLSAWPINDEAGIWDS
eukprot:scaffold672_cov126-Cylindrotheca_fusiformis.AAC.33